MTSAFGLALLLAVPMLAVLGTDAQAIRQTLRVTARFSYLLFWPAYAGGALAALFGPRFAPMARRGREFGLSFASAHVVHVGLVVWLYHISAKPPLSERSALFFSLGFLFTYLLALFSIRSLADMLGRDNWRILRTVGLEYIAYVFLKDFVTSPLKEGVLLSIVYLPFSILAIVGPVLRVTALLRRLAQSQNVASGFRT
jgi:undecaprenyl pyrophosphate phosphatase UppP